MNEQQNPVHYNMYHQLCANLCGPHYFYLKPKQYNNVYGFKYKICDGERC
jgi:hypothetical protein